MSISPAKEYNLQDILPELQQPDPVAIELPHQDGGEPLVFDPYNERMKFYGLRPEEIVCLNPTDVSEDFCSKITVYAPPGDEKNWENIGFKREAVIKKFFRDEDAHLWAAYTSQEREVAPKDELHEAGVQIALAKQPLHDPSLAEGYSSEIAVPSQSPEIASLLDETFADYPTPIDAEIIARQIHNEDNLFRVVRDPEGGVAAVASAELDHNHKSAEMTDCATRPDQRGRGLMAYLLRVLERDVDERFVIDDLYTIARADEVGMNCVFSKLGYEYNGRLINNCRMPNGWESMNVWCRNSKRDLS